MCIYRATVAVNIINTGMRRNLFRANKNNGRGGYARAAKMHKSVTNIFGAGAAIRTSDLRDNRCAAIRFAKRAENRIFVSRKGSFRPRRRSVKSFANFFSSSRSRADEAERRGKRTNYEGEIACNLGKFYY